MQNGLTLTMKLCFEHFSTILLFPALSNKFEVCSSLIAWYVEALTDALGIHILDLYNRNEIKSCFELSRIYCFYRKVQISQFQSCYVAIRLIYGNLQHRKEKVIFQGNKENG